MARDASLAYFETQVLTATPQQLRKLLIDGAIRFSLATKQAIEKNERDTVYLQFEKVRAIISELMSSIRSEEEFAKRTLNLYAFIMRHLVEAERQFDAILLDEVVTILKIESETWALVCEKWPEVSTEVLPNSEQPKEILASDASKILQQHQGAPFSKSQQSPRKSPTSGGVGGPSIGAGFSLDA